MAYIAYVVNVAESRYKTLLVNAESEAAAIELAEEAYYAGEYGFDDDPELEVLEATLADDSMFQITCFGGNDSDNERPNDDDIDTDGEDEPTTCEDCFFGDSCDNETKLHCMIRRTLCEFMKRMAEIYATYGEVQ